MVRKQAILLCVLLALSACGQAAPVLTATPTVQPATRTPSITPAATEPAQPTETEPPSRVSTAVADPTVETSFDGVRVTYVGNSGVLITTGDQKILIDGLFDGFPRNYSLPEDVYDALVRAEPPFDQIDLILVTHNHADHFSAGPARQTMQNNPDVVLISTQQVAEQLAEFGDRVIALNATEGNPQETDVNGILVKAIYLSHGTFPEGETEIVNNAYVVATGGIHLFHTGDIDLSLVSMDDLKNDGLPDSQLDIAFIPHFYLSEPRLKTMILGGIPSRYVVAIHYEYTDPIRTTAIEQNYPDAILFDQEMESWVMP